MTEEGVKLVAKFEGLPKGDPLAAYWDAHGKVWTIGYGATHYLDGTKVKEGDHLTSKEEAMSLLRSMLEGYEAKVRNACGDEVFNDLSSEQRDALTSFTYNVGAGNLKSSTLLKKVKANKDDSTIKDEFMKWNKSGGKVLAGLTKRRAAEAGHYFGINPEEIIASNPRPMITNKEYTGGGNMFDEVSNRDVIGESVASTTPTRGRKGNTRAADVYNAVSSDSNAWKVTEFKVIPRKSNNWKTLTSGSVHPVVGDLLFAYHDSKLWDSQKPSSNPKHDHVAIYLGVHEGNVYVAEGTSVSGNLINNIDDKVHIVRIQDSRMGLNTDVITHFAHCRLYEVKQYERTSESGGENAYVDESELKHFTIADLRGTNAGEKEKECLKALIKNTLDPLAEAFNGLTYKLRISSGFRDPSRNEAAEGVPKSQHIRGQGADLQANKTEADYYANLEIAKTILNKNIPFDQLIVEQVSHVPGNGQITRLSPRWIHVSYYLTDSNEDRIANKTNYNRYQIKYSLLGGDKNKVYDTTKEIILNSN